MVRLSHSCCGCGLMVSRADGGGTAAEECGDFYGARVGVCGACDGEYGSGGRDVWAVDGDSGAFVSRRNERRGS